LILKVREYLHFLKDLAVVDGLARYESTSPGNCTHPQNCT
jgi:hypothetical protein